MGSWLVSSDHLEAEQVLSCPLSPNADKSLGLANRILIPMRILNQHFLSKRKIRDQKALLTLRLTRQCIGLHLRIPSSAPSWASREPGAAASHAISASSATPLKTGATV
jgi:hypothetical protein